MHTDRFRAYIRIQSYTKTKARSGKGRHDPRFPYCLKSSGCIAPEADPDRSTSNTEISIKRLAISSQERIPMPTEVPKMEGD
jgi:hypothetical protein